MGLQTRGPEELLLEDMWKHTVRSKLVGRWTTYKQDFGPDYFISPKLSYQRREITIEAIETDEKLRKLSGHVD